MGLSNIVKEGQTHQTCWTARDNLAALDPKIQVPKIQVQAKKGTQPRSQSWQARCVLKI